MPSQEELLHRGGDHAARSFTDIDEAEQWASAIQSAFRTTSFEYAPSSTPRRVLAEAAARGDAGAAVLAAAMAVFGPESGRYEARRLWRRLTDGGVVVPAWVEFLGVAEPLGAVRLTDRWENDICVLVDFARPGGEVRGLGAGIDRLWDGLATDFKHGPASEALVEVADSYPEAIVEEIDLADARALISEGLRRRDECLPRDAFDESWGGEYGHYEDGFDEDLRALVDQRIGLLPPGGDASAPRPLPVEEVEAIAEDFMGWSRSLGQEMALGAVAAITEFSRYCIDGDPLRWSPQRIIGFLGGWLPDQAGCGAVRPEGISDVFPPWLVFAAARGGHDEEWLNKNLAAVGVISAAPLDGLDPWRTAASDPIVEGVLPGRAGGSDADAEDRETVREWLDRYRARPRHPHR